MCVIIGGAVIAGVGAIAGGAIASSGAKSAAQAQKDAAVEAERIRALAKSDAEKVAISARAEIEAAERAARIELKNLVAKLAASMKAGRHEPVLDVEPVSGRRRILQIGIPAFGRPDLNQELRPPDRPGEKIGRKRGEKNDIDEASNRCRCARGSFDAALG